MKKFGKFSLVTILFALAMFLQSLVQMFMWNWFIVPLGFTTISFWLAMGISLTISVFNPSYTKSDGELISHYITSGFVYMALWGVGAIIHLFV